VSQGSKSGGQASAALPKFEVDPFWPKPLPDRWVTGEVGGTCIGAQDHLFIVNRVNLTPDEQKSASPSPPVIEFDPGGNLVNSWGDLNVLPKSPHGCFIDYKGNVWIAGNRDGIVQEYTHDGSKLLLQIGTRGRLDTQDGTITGAPLNSSPTQLNEPSCVAVDPANGDIYISDGYGNRRVVVFDRNGNFLRQWGEQATGAQEQAGVGGVFLATVHCVALGNDGLVYVCDRKGDRIQVFDKMGKYLKSIPIKPGVGSSTGVGSAWWLAFSPDKAQTFMYVTDGADEAVWILDHATGQILSSFGRPGHQPGDFSFVHTVAVDSEGNLYLGETVNGRRVQKFHRVAQ
jgi:DNA-binding beta-propeller fold protein YncE